MALVRSRKNSLFKPPVSRPTSPTNSTQKANVEMVMFYTHYQIYMYINLNSQKSMGLQLVLKHLQVYDSYAPPLRIHFHKTQYQPPDDEQFLLQTCTLDQNMHVCLPFTHSVSIFMQFMLSISKEHTAVGYQEYTSVCLPPLHTEPFVPQCH